MSVNKLDSFNMLTVEEKAHIQAKAEESVERMACISSWMATEVVDNIKELLAALFIQSKNKILLLRTDAENAKKNIVNTPEYKDLKKSKDTAVFENQQAQNKIQELNDIISECQNVVEDQKTKFDIVRDIGSLIDEKFGTNICMTSDQYAIASIVEILKELIPAADTDKMNFTNSGYRSSY